MLDDIGIKAMKTGMLFDAKSIRTVVAVLRSYYCKDGASLPPLVCDPVCVSTSGHTLLQADALDVLISELLPLTFLVTPNKSEAELILSSRNLQPSAINDLEGMLVAVANLLTLGSKNVLLKGGHLTVTYQQVLDLKKTRPDVQIVSSSLYGENMEILQAAEGNLLSRDIVVDVLQNSEGATLYVRPRIDSTSTHGTGCTLSAALTCELSRGKSGKSSLIPRVQRQY